MTKEKRILSYFLGYVIIGLFIFLIGIISVNAASYTGFDFTAQLYDNLGPSLTAVTTSGPTAGTGAYEGYIAYAANSSGGAWGISSPITLIANHTYTLTASIPNECGNIILSSYNRIGVGTTLNNAKTSYQNNTNVNEVYSKAIQGNNYLIQYAFTPTINASFIIFPFATSVTCSSSRTLLESVTIDDLGTDAVTQDEINTSLTNQTNQINTSIENSTNTITGAITDTEDNINSNIDDMESAIVDSNKETQEVIKDQFNDCRDSVNILEFDSFYNSNGLSEKLNEDGSLNFSGTPTSEWANLGKNDGIILEPGTYTFSSKYSNSFDIFLRLYKEDNTYLDYTIWNGQTSITFTLEETAVWYYTFLSRLDTSKNYNVDLYLQLEKGSSATSWEKPGEICSNKIDETNDKLGNLNDSLNDSNVDGSLDSAGSFFDNFSTTDHGGLSGIITAPLVAINEMLNTSCSPMTATFKGKELSLPCGYEFWNRLGAIQDFVNIVLGGMLCYRIIIKLYKLIERIKNPEDDRLEVMDL